MRIAFLGCTLPGYSNACLRELASRPGVELFIAYQSPGPDAPFDPTDYGWIKQALVWNSKESLSGLQERVEVFKPDVIIISGWDNRAYRNTAHAWRGRCLRLLTMDNCWTGSLRQHLGVLIAPWHIRLLADAVYVPGERQAYFARRLGFRTILRGCLSCDHTNFSKIYLERTLSNNNPPNAFLFVGRLIAEKGISTLAEAYRIYRQFSSAPWPLICCGVGPQARLLESLTGVEMRGFVQPQELPEQMARASVLVIPSIFEPWALVVHEAAAAGLLILASEAVGSVPHLVHDNHNGYTFNPGDARRMAHLMGKISNLSSESIQQMSMASYAVSLQNTPQRWANTVMAFAVDYSGRQLRSHRD